jgi:hypothetical protein
MFVLWPAIIGGGIYLWLSLLLPDYAGIIAGGIVAIAYLVIFSRYLYQFWTGEDHQTIHDRIVGDYIDDDSLTSQSQKIDVLD